VNEDFLLQYWAALLQFEATESAKQLEALTEHVRAKKPRGTKPSHHQRFPSMVEVVQGFVAQVLFLCLPPYLLYLTSSLQCSTQSELRKNADQTRNNWLQLKLATELVFVW
jgi:hypothetical protein